MLDGATDQALLAIARRPKAPDQDDRYNTRRVQLPLRRRQALDEAWRPRHRRE